MTESNINPLAGEPAPRSMLVDVTQLVTAYFTGVPDAAESDQRIVFGTSGHRGSSLRLSFNELHILAMTHAVCGYRTACGIDGPLFLGMDTHALSVPAAATALEVLAANGVTVMIAANGEYTPTPVISHAILRHNSGRTTGLADGIVVTPSHNPPEDGGFKYNPPHGGPADASATRAIETAANAVLESGAQCVQRIPYERALRAAGTHEHDFLGSYVADLARVVDMDAIRRSGVRMGVDPLGGAGVHYWPRIAEHFRLDLTVIRDVVDPTFSFMPLDWDGRIRMDPSSSYAMRHLTQLKDRYDVAFACDTDHDRHGVVCPGAGLMPPNHYLSVAIDYLFQHRPGWHRAAAIGKTLVSSQMIDRVAARLGRTLYEVPVGFKWFVDGLLTGTLAFAGEESAGASFSRIDGAVWTTDKDGIAPALLAAEITARSGRNPARRYQALIQEFGEPATARLDAPANAAQKRVLLNLSPQQIHSSTLAGDKIEKVLTRAPGNDAPIGGLKVISQGGWFAARPSGTEDIYKIYAESFRGNDHLQAILVEAQSIVGAALTATPDESRGKPLETTGGR